MRDDEAQGTMDNSRHGTEQDAGENLETGSAEDGPIIGVIGGSGLYSLFDEDAAASRRIETPYGPTSADIVFGRLGGRSVAFLPRHATGHTLPPHRIPYRANFWALASIGVKAVVTSSAVGSVDPRIPPETIVIPDQLIDRTWGRDDTYFDGTDVQHLSHSDPYCPELRAVAARALDDLGQPYEGAATTVVIQGPRFSTRAESRSYRSLGAHLVNMTQYPETALAAELNLGLVNLSYVTDTDAGEPGGGSVDPAIVLERMAAAGPRIRAAIAAIVTAVPDDYAPRRLIPDDSVSAVLSLPARTN